MSNLSTYIKEFGDISFQDMSFGDGDNIAMCYMYYMPFEKVVSSDFDDEPVPFSVAANNLFAQRGYKHKAVGLILPKNISVQMMEMAKRKRYAQMKVVACTEIFEKEPAVQFNAATFLLPNGDIVILFRGTDDTFTGWKEDVDIITRESIPSNNLATQYLEKAAEKFDGDIIICGHSKGGYVAQYGALNCKKEVRDRIKWLYNNDGPGFQDYSFLDTDAYKELLPRYKHFVPQSSFIGMLLYHDDDYKIVKSNRVLGALQHDLATWQFQGDTLKTVNELTPQGKVNDLVMYNLVNNMTREQTKAFDDVISTVINGNDNVGLLDIPANVIPTIKNSKTAVEGIEDDTIKCFQSAFSDLGNHLVNSVRTVRSGEFTSVKDRKKNQ